jgi:hypothetical protein
MRRPIPVNFDETQRKRRGREGEEKWVGAAEVNGFP